jgi:putative transposase
MEQDPVGGTLRPDNIRPPGYAALRRFRKSKPSAEYFLTINLAKRGPGLERPALTTAVVRQWDKLEAEKHWLVRTATVMPDHLHLLVRLGESKLLAECIKLLKGRLSPDLRAAGLRWQDGFYDHQLRLIDDVMAVFLYIYLNPYRAGLIPETEIWPGYRCRPEDWDWFGQLTRESIPQPEWLR